MMSQTTVLQQLNRGELSFAEAAALLGLTVAETESLLDDFPWSPSEEEADEILEEVAASLKSFPDHPPACARRGRPLRSWTPPDRVGQLSPGIAVIGTERAVSTVYPGSHHIRIAAAQRAGVSPIGVYKQDLRAGRRVRWCQESGKDGLRYRPD